MNFICLAAGKGTRFGRLNRFLQKCLYPINGKPFLEYSLQNLSSFFNVDVFLTIVVGFRMEQIMNYFANRYNNIHIKYVIQEDALGTGHALKLAYDSNDFDSKTYFFWHADNLLRKEHLKSLLRSNEKNILSVSKNKAHRKSFERFDIKGDKITKAFNGSSDYVDVGISKLSENVMSYMGNLKTNEYRYLLSVQAAIENGERVVYQKEDNWIHLGDIEPSFEESIKEVTKKVGGF